MVLLQGGAWTPSFGRGRGLRRLAHRLAAEGFHVARFDYHGVGESSGEVRTFALDQPFIDDLAAVVRWLATDYGLERYLLIGTCFGARTALAAAPNIAGLEALAMFPPPVRDHVLGEQFSSYSLSWYLRRLFRVRTLKRLLNPRFRRAYRRLFRSKVRAVGHGLHNPADSKGRSPEVSQIFLRQLKSLIARRIPIYLLYGDADADYDDFNRALSGELGEVINSAGELAEGGGYQGPCSRNDEHRESGSCDRADGGVVNFSENSRRLRLVLIGSAQLFHGWFRSARVPSPHRE